MSLFNVILFSYFVLSKICDMFNSIIIGLGKYLPENIVTNADLEKIIDGIEPEPDYDTPTLLRQEDKHKEETLDEFFQSLDRYKPGLSEIAKRETDRINTLSLPHFITDDKKLRYAYLAGLERGWHEARAEHLEVLRDLLKGKIDG